MLSPIFNKRKQYSHQTTNKKDALFIKIHPILLNDILHNKTCHVNYLPLWDGRSNQGRRHLPFRL